MTSPGDRDALVHRLQERLVRLCLVPSPSRDERAVADLLTEEFGTLGMDVREDDAGAHTGGNAGNLVAELPGGRAERVVLAAHMDTVPLVPGVPLVAEVAGSVVRSSGRQILGADDKAGVAVILELLARAARTGYEHRPTLVAVVTVCEELGLLGAKHLDVAALGADFAYSFDGEVQVGEVITSAVFKDDVTVTVTGKAAHAALEPERGVHAIKATAEVVAAVPLGRVAADQVLNFGAIRGGGPTNVVPSEVVLRGEFRAFSKTRLDELAADVTARAEAAAARHGASVAIERRHLYDGYAVAADAGPMQRLAAAAPALGERLTPVASIGGSDTSILNQKGLLTVNVGVAMHEIHSVGEWIDADDLARVVEWVGTALGLAGA